VFVDDTGGWGASWIDNLRRLGREPVGIGFAARPNDPRYDNKRTEIYFEAVEWIKAGGALPPDCAELIAALSQTTYSFRGDRLLLEPKEQVKSRLGYSPDEADAFALTFAQPAVQRGPRGGIGRAGGCARLAQFVHPIRAASRPAVQLRRESIIRSQQLVGRGGHAYHCGKIVRRCFGPSKSRKVNVHFHTGGAGGCSRGRVWRYRCQISRARWSLRECLRRRTT
jgi:hypothetical protein